MTHFRILLVIVSIIGYAKQASAAHPAADSVSSSFDTLLDSALSLFNGQKVADSQLTPDFCRTFLTQDMSNEDIATSSAQQMISRSGYKHESHYVTSDDGYITQLIRIINPLADRAKLKQPPVMMMHGGITDMTSWIFSSSIQHHPEKWPRTVQDGPMTSWNKSLAFVLANNGYDVWLVGTRGSNLQNKRHTKLKRHLDWFDQQELAKMRGGDTTSASRFVVNFEENFRYWNYTMDDLGQFEVPRQQEKILEVTGSANVTLVDFSFGTMIDLALMSENPKFVSRLHNYFTMATIVNIRTTNMFVNSVLMPVLTKLPLPIGNIIAQILLSPPVRTLLVKLSSCRELRYSITKTLLRAIAGPSGQYETNLDMGVVGHLFMPTGYKESRHYAQQVMAGHLQKYDHGPVDNMRLYGSLKPPKYDLAKIELPHWMIVSGGNDKLATVESVKQMVNSIKRAPDRHVHIERFNHLDLIAAVENDKYVNLPVLEFLDGLALPPLAPSKPPKQPQEPNRSNKHRLNKLNTS